jgi:hypothetical protein
MARGPGKYDEECSVVQRMTNADIALVAIINGDKGSGFSVQCFEELDPIRLARVLEEMAQQLRDEKI